MTALTDERIKQAERQFGVPREIVLSHQLDERDLGFVAGSLHKHRRHDVTFFIEDGRLEEGGHLAVIRKPMFPRGVYRAPSGGIKEGESLEEGALREAWEETGLEIALERYVLRIDARFFPPAGGNGLDAVPAEVRDPDHPSVLQWWTHVFISRPVGSTDLQPLDTHEIEAARWITPDELQGPIRERMIASGSGLFAYRVALTDATLAELGVFEGGRSS